ncbi:MAG: HU family DNA-binding protein [Methylotetracoccus sp.]
MDKKDLIDAIATETGLKRSKVDDVLNALAANVHDDCARAKWPSRTFCRTISVKQRAARPGRNPRTGETIDIPARRVRISNPVRR